MEKLAEKIYKDITNPISFKKYVADLWKEFGEVPMNPVTEEIESEWHGFPIGTHREEIWHWFEETFHVSVADLMGRGGK